MKKIICNQCKECQLPYLPNNKIPCSDTDCKCHTVKQGGRYNKTYILEEKLEPCLWDTCVCWDEEEHRQRNKI